jgi:hypothetical protein
MSEELAEFWARAWEFEATGRGVERGPSFWNGAYEWILGQRASRRTP